jgi:CheY-like chemotaxis protein
MAVSGFGMGHLRRSPNNTSLFPPMSCQAAWRWMLFARAPAAAFLDFNMAVVPRRSPVDSETVISWLDRLDRKAGPPSGLDRRMSRRVSYRPGALSVELMQGDDVTGQQRVVGRNLSREGVGLIADRFVYPNTACRVRLGSPFGGEQRKAGRVARSRYLVGSGSLYEVGVEFTNPLDVAIFAPHARLIRVLLVDAASSTHDLVAGFLRPGHVELNRRANADEACEALKAEDYDLVLVDLDSQDCDAFALVSRFRSEGYVGPVIGLTVQADAELQARCVAAGYTGYLTKPVLREDLQRLVESLSDMPLVSSLAQDPNLAPLIDRFVAGLRERVSALAQAREADDLPTLGRLARELRAEAASYGFGPITDEAAYLEAMIALESPGERVGRATHRLIDLCLRARPASAPFDATIGVRRFSGTAGST